MTASTAYEEKIDSRFRTFDRDGDGVLSEADFVIMAEDVLAKFGESHTGEKGQALLDGARQFWRGLADAVDADGDGRITRQEFAQGAKQNLLNNAEGFDRIVRPWATALAVVADTDGSGALDEAEYERLLTALGATANAHRAAAGTEHNSDGQISHEQVVANTVAFYTSESPAHIDDLFQPEARG